MDIEKIKIEPPIVVKEELEVDNNKNIKVKLENEEKPQLVAVVMSEWKTPSTSEFFEEIEYDSDQPFAVAKVDNFRIKLEDEEKPQPVKEFTLIENEPSTSETVEEDEFELDEMSLHTCCYCGDMKTSTEMVRTPETENELSQWSKLLGEKNCEILTIRSPICRIHFIDKFGDSRLIDVVRGSRIARTKIGNKMKCCYCGKSRMRKSMTSVPNDEHNFVKWSKILGKGFCEHFKTKVLGLICRSHFGVEWKGPRPRTLLPIADQESEKDAVLENNNERTEIKLVCAFCEDSKYSHEMAQISKQSNKLKTWRDILGKDFYKRALSNKQTFICQSHFDVEWKEYDCEEILANSDRNLDESVLEKRKKTCVYCGESKSHHDLTLSPTNPNTLKQWADILGDDFYRRASLKTVTYICRSHFDVKWEGQRPWTVFPCVDVLMSRPDIDLCNDNLYTCCCCGERKEYEKMLESPATVGELLEWYRILGEKFYKNSQNSKSSMVCRSHFNISYLNKTKSEHHQNITKTVQLNGKSGKNIKHPTLSTCAYCGETKPFQASTIVPHDSLTLKKWGDILGEEFYKRARGNGISSICRSHFNVGWHYVRPSDLLPHADPVQESSAFLSKEVKLEEPDMIEDPDRKPLRLLDQSIKPEARSQEFAEKTADENTHSDNQDESSDLKRIKLEIKKEENMD